MPSRKRNKGKARKAAKAILPPAAEEERQWELDREKRAHWREVLRDGKHREEEQEALQQLTADNERLEQEAYQRAEKNERLEQQVEAYEQNERLEQLVMDQQRRFHNNESGLRQSQLRQKLQQKLEKRRNPGQLDQCLHNYANSVVVPPAVNEFMISFADSLPEGKIGQTKGQIDGALCAALEAARAEHPGLLEDDSLRGMIRQHMASSATSLLLTAGISAAHASLIPICYAILLIEDYRPGEPIDGLNLWLPVSDMSHLRNRDVVEGCVSSLVRFLDKRTSCTCIRKKCAEMLSQPKTGICLNCQERLPRHSLWVCTGCRGVQYCSRSCQVENVSEHKGLCREMQAHVAKEAQARENANVSE